MGIKDRAEKLFGKIDPRIVAAVEKRLKKLTVVNRFLERQYDDIMKELEGSLRPYAEDFATHHALPKTGRDRKEILKEIAALHSREEDRWKEGFVSGAVYHGDAEHTDFLSRVYALTSQTNPLHSDLWPSISKYEAEVVSMTGQMLGAATTGDDGVSGVVSSGGTESILLAMKAYRDWAREEKGITRPEMVVPDTAHAAFDKASKYFQIKINRVPVDSRYRADVAAMEKAVTANTIVMVGSTPSYPHGAIDPIAELSEVARKRGIGFHTDACLGGFILPWAKRLGYPVPKFDFQLPGVTSISADTHKYGYAAKGSSVILYRGRDLLHAQYYTIADWPGGLYFSPTFAGSRSGALSAMCWAALVSMGEEGYLEAARKILETAATIREGAAAIDGLDVLGDPLFVIALASKELDIYKVMDFMTKRKWNLNGLFNPPAVHICVTLRHTTEGVAERFLSDLNDAVIHVRANPKEKGTFAPIYGLASSIPLKGTVSDLLMRYLDMLYKV
ncbi:MAG: aminotransferase class V-fold PLP-dependent enzyme [Deltaproteobacteria bacterium]|nr:aminotransferase class V-fold PLP-dependent enzyme [Deltaproteobacteria bacterium]